MYKPGESGNPATQFSKDHQPKNPGRKPSILKKFIQETDIGSDDINLVIKNIIFEKNQEELQEILEDKQQPMLVRIFIRAFLEDFKRGDLTRVETLANRAIGKPRESIDLKHSGEVVYTVLPAEIK